MMNNDGSVKRTERGKRGLLSRIVVPVPDEYRSQFNAKLLDTNVDRMYALAIYIVVIQIVLNLINIFKPSDTKSSDIMIYIVLSMLALSVGLIYWVLLLLVRKNKITGTRVKSVLVYSLLYVYIGIQLVFCTLNVISTGGVNSYIIAILILGLFPILPPLKSVATILLSFGYVILAMYLTRSVSSTWNSILLTDAWTNLIIITGVIMCISVFIYDMYVYNFLQSIRLHEANEELVKANDMLKIMANTDQMTGVSNRRAFSQDFDRVWHDSFNRNKLAVAILDIDFFKAYNDKFGHLEGDKALQLIATSLKNSFRRSSDIVSRYGGEEFLVVFDANRNDAFDMVERARKNVEDLKIEHATQAISPYVTISAGVCVIVPSDQVSAETALKIADESLYESKNTGRNKTTLREFDPKKDVFEAENGGAEA